MIKRSFFILSSIYLFSSINASATTWNIYMYMESGNYLHQAALQNLNDIAKNKPDNVNIYVLLHYKGDTAMLYKIEKNIILQLKEVSLGVYVSEIFVPIVKELEEENPAQRHCVILWNHGYGILVPYYNEQNEDWEVAVDDENEVCPLRCIRDLQHKNHKGMLINMETKTCMGNEELISLFDRLCNEVFHKKIDICGLDMCKGAMVEHGYQVRNYVDILIGSQECELADGWPYDLILPELQKNSAMQAKEFAIAIIDAYKNYYQKHAPIGIYTQSAFDLQYIEVLKQQLDCIAEQLIILMQENNFREVLGNVRKQCRAFCDAPMYIDCYAFLEYLSIALQSQEKNKHTEVLEKACKKSCEIISKMVLANAVGDAIDTDVHGVSLYHPRKNIDSSYLDVPFAQEGRWLTYLQNFVGEFEKI